MRIMVIVIDLIGILWIAALVGLMSRAFQVGGGEAYGNSSSVDGSRPTRGVLKNEA